MKRACVFCFLGVLGVLGNPALAGAGGDEVVAVKAGTIWTGAGKAISDGVLLLRDGKIEAVGARSKVEIPPGARILDVSDGVVLPGLVNSYSRLGLFSRVRSPLLSGSRSGFSNKSDANPAAELFLRQKVFQDLLEAGVTTVGLIPGSGGGITGTVAVIQPHGKTRQEMVLKEGVLLRIGFPGGTSAMSGLKTLLDRAKAEEEKVGKARKRRADWEKREAAKRKRAEEKRKKEAKKKKVTASAEDKDDRSGKEKKKPESEGPKVPDLKPNIEPIVRARSGELRVLLEIPGPAVLDHFNDVLKDRHTLDFILVTGGRTAVHVKDALKEKKIPVLLAPVLTTHKGTVVRINPAAILEEAGVEFGFRPSSDRMSSIRDLLFEVAVLIKCGLGKETAVRAMTLTPARFLGVDKEVGSLEKGKTANLLCFRGDPLESPLAELKYVLLSGRVVHEVEDPGSEEE